MLLWHQHVCEGVGRGKSQRQWFPVRALSVYLALGVNADERFVYFSLSLLYTLPWVVTLMSLHVLFFVAESTTSMVNDMAVCWWLKWRAALLGPRLTRGCHGYVPRILCQGPAIARALPL
jgi:hypothetical protein